MYPFIRVKAIHLSARHHNKPQILSVADDMGNTVYDLYGKIPEGILHDQSYCFCVFIFMLHNSFRYRQNLS